MAKLTSFRRFDLFLSDIFFSLAATSFALVQRTLLRRMRRKNKYQDCKYSLFFFPPVVCMSNRNQRLGIGAQTSHILYAHFVASDIQNAIAHHHNTQMTHLWVLDLPWCCIWHGTFSAIWMSIWAIFIVLFHDLFKKEKTIQIGNV